MSLEQISANQSFGGQQLRYKHQSELLNCEMHFSIYIPPQAQNKSVPVLYWLSGRTCTDENFVQKAGAQQFAAKLGLAIVCPDTSPRGDYVPDDPEGAYDMGLGAGLYINATQEPWAKHYQMYDYVVDELPALINSQFPVDGQSMSISGHSMGGHGALTIALKNPQKYKSVSAFSPICSPVNCPWGEKVFSHYLGDNKSEWLQHDTVELLKQSPSKIPVLVDQGEADNFLAEQLNTPLLADLAKQNNSLMTVRMQPAYDHSYFFVSSFLKDHVLWHKDNVK